MKIGYVIFMSLMLMTFVQSLSTFHFHHGDQLLEVLQEMDGNVYVLMIAKDSTTLKELQLTNARVADGLYHNVLTVPQDPPADGKELPDPEKRDVVWARVNADDGNNGHLLDRLKVDLASLDEWPTVIVLKNGAGYSMHGPTTVRHAMRHVDVMTGDGK